MVDKDVTHEHPSRPITRQWWKNIRPSESAARRLFGHSNPKLSKLFEPIPRPMRPLSGTTAGATALYQLQIRSGQLNTPARLLSRNMSTGGCSLCSICPAEADEHHIFVVCPAVQTLKTEHQAKFQQRLRRTTIDQSVKDEYIEGLSLNTSDGSHWLNGVSSYYTGNIPERMRLGRSNPDKTLALSILANQSIILASQIWSIHKQTLWKTHSKTSARQH